MSSHVTFVTSQKITTCGIVSISVGPGCGTTLQLMTRDMHNTYLARLILSGRRREREGSGIYPVLNVRHSFVK